MSERKILTFLSKTGDYEIIIWYNNKLDNYRVCAYCFETDTVLDQNDHFVETEREAMVKARIMIEEM